MPEPTGNAAFDAARAGGVVDTFLAFPDVAAEKAKVYDWVRKASLDKETQSMEMPAQYMFKDVPHYDEIDDPLELVLTEMERFGIKRFVSNVARERARPAGRCASSRTSSGGSSTSTPTPAWRRCARSTPPRSSGATA